MIEIDGLKGLATFGYRNFSFSFLSWLLVLTEKNPVTNPSFPSATLPSSFPFLSHNDCDVLTG